MTKSEDWHNFCVDQIDRMGGAFPDFRFYKQPAIDELVAWLETKANGDKQAAMTFVTEVTEFENLPKISDLNALWRRLNPKPEEVRKDCHRCQGSGFVQVEGPYGLSSAYPCTHQPETESDRRMGLRMTPTQAKRYMDESTEAGKRQVEWFKRREKSGDTKQFQRVTQADVDALIGHLGI